MLKNVDTTNTKTLKNVNNLSKYVMAEHNLKNIKPSLKMLANDIKLPNSEQIHDMKKGTDLIRKAIKNDWKIVIYSDYDTDGITSNTIMYSLLKKLGAKHVIPFCPSRKNDGYGLNMKRSKQMVKQHIDLVITTDNGISCVNEIKYLRNHNVNVIITDHHEWKLNSNGTVDKAMIPKANAIIMANCPFDKFHFTGFCGAGIAFMIACYMLHRVATEYLDIACLGTVADSVPLQKEDRVIVYYGLKEIRNSKRLGIQALAQNAQPRPFDLTKMTSTELSFTIIPELNCLGRMECTKQINGENIHFDANTGRKLLLATK